MNKNTPSCSTLFWQVLSDNYRLADPVEMVWLIEKYWSNIRLFLKDIAHLPEFSLEHKLVFRILFNSRDRCNILFKTYINQGGVFMINNDSCIMSNAICKELSLKIDWTKAESLWRLLDKTSTSWDSIWDFIRRISSDWEESDEIIIDTWESALWLRAMSLPLNLLWELPETSDWYHKRIILLLWKELSSGMAEIDKLLADMRIIHLNIVNHQRSAFIAALTHEVRTPFHQLISSLNLLQDNTLTKLERKEMLESALDSAKSLLAMHENILEFTRLDSWEIDIQLSRFNLWDLIYEICNKLKDDVNKRINFNFPEILWIEVILDRKKLKKIILSLLGNAIKFTKKWEIRLEIKIESDRLHFMVCDTWQWIKDKFVKTMFDPLTMANESSTRWVKWIWMWLAIIKKIIERLEWEITHRTREWKWTAFMVSLPIEVLSKWDWNEEMFVEDWFVFQWVCLWKKWKNVGLNAPGLDSETGKKSYEISIASSSHVIRIILGIMIRHSDCISNICTNISDILSWSPDIIIIDRMSVWDYEIVMNLVKWKNIRVMLYNNWWSESYKKVAKSFWVEAYNISKSTEEFALLIEKLRITDKNSTLN